jgi:hypothetical protein
MAIVFELVVNFGRDEEAVAAATGELDRHPQIELRDTPLAITPPVVTRFRSGEKLRYIEFSVHPRGIGYAGPGPLPPFKARDLTDEEVTSVGERLYELLRRFSGYNAAMVGWDPECKVDVGELEVDWVRDGSIGQLHGLVLSEALVSRWRLEGFSAFEPGCMWLPYRGISNFWAHP